MFYTDLVRYLTKKASPVCTDSNVVEFLFPQQLIDLKDILKRCVSNSESNSLLVVGARGVGKTKLVKTSIHWLESLEEAVGNYSVVELHGSVHTDDRIALKDITRQLNLENVVGDKVFGSFAENLQFLLDSLKSGGIQRSSAKSSIFVLDDFEKFTQHKNQTLLYNLFDVAQSKQAPIAVIGLCSRIDAVELLEKRVKSRFSHRFIYMLEEIPPEKYREICKLVLSLDKDAGSFADAKSITKWNKHVASAVKNMENSLMKLYTLDRTLRTLIYNIQPMIRRIDEDLQLDTEIFDQTVKNIFKNDPKTILIRGMPPLQIVLLVCMLRLNAIYDGEPFNFELLYKEFIRFINQAKSSLQTDKNIVFKAFEGICNLELAQAISGGMESQKRYKLHHLHFAREHIKSVAGSGCLPTDICQWVNTTLSDKALAI